MELLERESPLTTLDAQLAAAAAGTGAVVLLAGEAGIGKTSLAREFCRRHREQARVLWGACDALTTPRPLGPLYDIARATGGELAAIMASEAPRHERFSAFLEELGEPPRPVIAVVEDVHWADDATRDLLIFVSRRIADAPAVLVVTYRDDEVGADHPLHTVLGSIATLPAGRRIALSRLSGAAVAALAEQHGAADPARLHQVTGGNPFFVTELLAAGPGTVPATVSDAVLARAAPLSPAARATLAAASIFPDQAELTMLAALTSGSAAALGECEQAGLLHCTGRTVQFRHELARLAVEQTIPAADRLDLHARALAQLVNQAVADPARLAYHADAAGDRDAVLTHAPVAAAHASRLGAHREAAAHYRRTLPYGPGLPARQRAELLESYARECSQISQISEALEASGQALAAWREAGDVDRTGQCLAQRGLLLWRDTRNQAAHESTRAAIAMLRRRPAGPALAAAYACDAYLRMLARDLPGALDMGSRGAELAERYGEPELLSLALNAVGSALFFTDPDRAERTLARSLAVARRAGDDQAAANAMSNLGSGAGEIRQYRVADRWLAEAITYCQQRDLDTSLSYALAWSARSGFEQGRWAQAGATADQVTRSTAMAPSRIVALTVLGRLRARRGDPDPDTPLAQAWRLAQDTGDLQRLWPVAAGRAEAAWLAGQPDQIPQLVTDTYRLAEQLGQSWAIGELGYWLWRAGSWDSPPEPAADPYARQIRGDWAGAAASWQQLGCPYEAALARIESDQPDELRAALTTLARLGANPLADHTAARLRALGVRDLPRRPSPATLANPAGLTRRELEVLGLLASGATNQDIAARLHISPKTAGHHVSAILTKLAVPSRHQAAQVATAMGIVPGNREPRSPG